MNSDNITIKLKKYTHIHSKEYQELMNVLVDAMVVGSVRKTEMVTIVKHVVTINISLEIVEKSQF